ncbi:hypothetical protein J7M07_07435 [bacterium]|nr:hypothetical protein [bacterium]
MFKRSISMIVIVSVLSLVWYSCSEDGINQPNSKSEGSISDETENLNEELLNDPQVKELEAIGNELIQIAIDREITQEELESAVKDEQIAAATLGMSRVESEKLLTHIKELGNSLLIKYPELKNMVQKRMKEDCEGCQTNEFINNWDKIRAHQGQDNGRELLKMSYFTYIVALVGCYFASAGNILLYAICAYVVYCNYTGKC